MGESKLFVGITSGDKLEGTVEELMMTTLYGRRSKRGARLILRIVCGLEKNWLQSLDIENGGNVSKNFVPIKPSDNAAYNVLRLLARLFIARHVQNLFAIAVIRTSLTSSDVATAFLDLPEDGPRTLANLISCTMTCRCGLLYIDVGLRQ
ncbi:hypothetical protein MRX96_034128 [Rhipicephalus microplus]